MGAGASLQGHTGEIPNNLECPPESNGCSPVRAPRSTTNQHTSYSSAATSSRPLIRKPPVESSSSMKMSCEMCSVTFTFFKRKKFCQDCQRYFCSTCLPKPNSSSHVGRQCSKCRLLVSGHFSRQDLETWKVKDMRCFLNVRNISTKECREKHDLIELVLARFCTRQRNSIHELEEHEVLVQQMAAHVRDVSHGTVGLDTSHSATNGSHTAPQMSTGSDMGTSSPTHSPSTRSTATGVQAPPWTSFSYNPPDAQDTDGCSTSIPDAEVNKEPETGDGDDDGIELNSEQLRELLETTIQDMLAGNDEEADTMVETERTAIRRTQLDDITKEREIEGLAIRQLKELLVNNFVDYRGCCEKAELVERTRRLWRDHKNNRIKAEQIHKEDEDFLLQSTCDSLATSSGPTVEEGESKSEPAPAESTDDGSGDGPSQTSPAATEAAAPQAASASTDTHLRDNLCHICMDSLIDCILLECGHMTTCTQCGKKLAECPICRQYISRIVRVFRS